VSEYLKWIVKQMQAASLQCDEPVARCGCAWCQRYQFWSDHWDLTWNEERRREREQMR
jgi:hypothetical protein